MSDTREERLRDEFELHLELETEANLRRGMTPEEARRAARVAFGAHERFREEARDQFRSPLIATLMQDARYALRTFRRNPAFTTVVVTTLALTIGANTAIFSVAQAALFAPLPYGHPGSLVAVSENPRKDPSARYGVSVPDLADYRAQQHTLTGMTGFYERPSTWRLGSADPEVVNAMRVTANFFDVLGVPAWLGHTFVSGDDAPGAPGKVVLAYEFWHHDLGGDSAIIGGTTILQGDPFTIVGVMPPGFAVSADEALWVPVDLSDDLAHAAVTRKQRVLQVIGRLKPGSSVTAARTDLLAISTHLESQYPEANAGLEASIVPLRESVSARFAQPVLLLLAAALLILVIACANLANVTLSRGLTRQGEMAVRAALGASGGRLARQVLVESITLSLVGGALGIAVAVAGTRSLLALNPGLLPSTFTVAIDGRVLAVSAAVSVLTGMLFGLAPALTAARSDLQSALKDRGRGGTGGHSAERTRRILVVSQVSLAVILLSGAGLLLRSFHDLTTVRLGFNPDHILSAQIRVDGSRYDSAGAMNRFYDQVLGEIEAAPGVVSVGAAMYIPAQGKEYTSLVVDWAPDQQPRGVAYNMVRGNYFPTLGLPLVSGRGFDQRDQPGTPGRILINEAAARAFFPQGNAVGHRVRMGPDPTAPWTTIIGVVADMRDAANWIAPEPTIYDNGRQQTSEGTLSLVVRTQGDPSAAAPLIRRAVKNADPSLALRDVRSLDDVIAATLAPRKFGVGLATAFAGLALILAGVGIYGVVAYSVSTRTREFGVRLALGAGGRRVLLLVLRQGLIWAFVGLVLGLVGAYVGGHLLASALFGVSPRDPLTMAVVAVTLLSVVVIASLVPARRATRVDPVTSLRTE